MQVSKVVELDTLELSDSKESKLKHLLTEYNKVAKFIFKVEHDYSAINQTELHEITYNSIRKSSNLPVQLIQTARREVWSKRKQMNKIKTFPIKLETYRAVSFTKSNRGNFIVCIAGMERHKRIKIPIKQDGAFQRFQSFVNDGWGYKSCIIIKKHNSWKVQIILRKEFPEPKPSNIVVGIDTGSKWLCALSVYDSVNNKILKQIYLGKDIAHKQKSFEFRRKILQKKDTCRARSSLKRLSSKQRMFVKTRTYQIAHQIVYVAKEYTASICIENLSIRNGRSMGKRFNTLIHRIPYGMFFSTINDIAVCEGVLVRKVNPRNTSIGCSKCGCIDKMNRRGSTFKCINCGFTVNADRNASVNIAKKFREREISKTCMASLSTQNSLNRLSVNTGLHSDDGICL